MRTITTTLAVTGGVILGLGLLSGSFWFTAVGGAMLGGFLYERSNAEGIRSHTAAAALGVHSLILISAIGFAWWWSVSTWTTWA